MTGRLTVTSTARSSEVGMTKPNGIRRSLTNSDEDPADWTLTLKEWRKANDFDATTGEYLVADEA
jgi:hypothetical protein